MARVSQRAAQAGEEAVGSAPAAASVEATSGATTQLGSASANAGDEGALPPGGDGTDAQGDGCGSFIAVRAVSAKGRWRIGRHFTPAPSYIPEDELGDADLERLQADPELIVSID